MTVRELIEQLQEMAAFDATVLDRDVVFMDDDVSRDARPRRVEEVTSHANSWGHFVGIY